jgi:beta-glucanase (GH16 family)
MKTYFSKAVLLRSALVGLASASLYFGAVSVSSADTQTKASNIQPHFTNVNRRKLLDSFVKTYEDGHDWKNWYISDFIVDDDFFQVGWSSRNVIFDDEDVILALTHQRMGKKPYTGSEYQKKGWSQYGRYEVIMKSAPGEGVITGFFTHTAQYFKDPHDEIDIEFLGKDPHLIQFNIYRDGKSLNHGHQMKLPFDTTEEFHLYAFEWTPTKITWFIDDEEVFSVTDKEFDIPDAPQRLMAQVWTGNIFQWHGKPNFEDGTSAVIRCMSYTRLGDAFERCGDKMELLED